MRPKADLVGRREDLQGAMEALGAGGRLLLVLGDAGIGKSRFVAEVLDRLEDDGSLAVSGGCLPLAEKLPLLPLTEALRTMARLRDGDLIESALDRSPEFARPEIARLMPQLGGNGAAVEPLGGWQRERLFTAVGHVLQAVAADSGLVLLVEDLHWADEGTLDLLTYLFSGGVAPDLRLVVTCRSDEPRLGRTVADWLAHARRSPEAHEVRLGPLSRDETRALVAGLLATGPTSELVAEVHDRTEGNPFFVEQLVGAALDASHGGEPRLPARLPAGLADLLTARVTEVGEDARWTLGALAVVRRPMTEPLLATIAGQDPTTVRQALHELFAAGLLASPSRDETTRPRHALLAESVLDNLLPGERAALHARAAEALDALGDPTLAAEVALHWAEAGRPAEELRATLTAAQATQRVFAFSEAAELWLHAINLSDAHPHLSVEAEVDIALLHVRAVDALAAAGRRPECGPLAARALARFADVPDPQTAAAVHLRAARHRDRGAPEDANRLIERALRLFDEAPPSAEHAEALLLHASLQRHQGHTDRGAADLERALSIAEQADAVAVAARALGPLSFAYFLRADLERGFASLRRGRALVDQLAASGTDPESAAAAVSVFESHALLRVGRMEDARSAAMWGLDHLRQSGRERSFGATVITANVLTANAVEALLELGRTADAATLIDPATAEPPDADNWPLHGSRAVVDLWRGLLPEATLRMRAIAAIASSRSLSLDNEYQRDLAEVALWDRRPDEALEVALTTLGRVEGTDEQLFCSELMVLGARACADLAESARARRDDDGLASALAGLARLADIVDRMGGAPFVDHPFVARIPADRAAWAAERGRAEGVGEPAQWQATAEEFDALGRPHRVAYARWRQAEAVLNSGGTAGDAAPILRAGANAAVEAAPLLELISSLAARARIRLDQVPSAAEPPPPAPAPFGLTDRELLVLRLLATGRTNRQIGAELYMSPKTASVHVSNILRKLGATNRVEAATLAERAGIGERDRLGS